MNSQVHTDIYPAAESVLALHQARAANLSSPRGGGSLERSDYRPQLARTAASYAEAAEILGHPVFAFIYKIRRKACSLYSLCTLFILGFYIALIGSWFSKVLEDLGRSFRSHEDRTDI